MPDGKRNSLSPEGETEGVDCFYNDVEDIQNSNSATKRLPLSLNTRGYHNLSERLLKTMVANEIKKTLDVEDNKRLVAHHRPVLHSENEISESDMVVVGVVMNAKQSQNDEVGRAIEMLRRNGVSCMFFSLKDTPGGGNGMKKDDVTTINTTEEKLNDTPGPEQDENSQILDTSEKKVSSPTVSTTSDYTTPPEDVIESPEAVDSSCTSTTFSVLKTIEKVEGPTEAELSNGKDEVKEKVFSEEIDEQEKVEEEQDTEPPRLSPLPPILFPQETITEEKETCEDQSESTADSAVAVKVTKQDTAMRRKKRRKRMYPYVSRRKAKNKKRKKEVQAPPEILPEKESLELSQPQEETTSEFLTPVENTNRKLTLEKEQVKSTSVPVDPYEFEEDSDLDSQTVDTVTFKTPSGRNGHRVILPKKGSSSQKNLKPFVSPSTKKRPATKKKRTKGSPRKWLTFSKNRAISPDITNSASFPAAQRRAMLEKSRIADEESNTYSPITESSCVQPISTSMDMNSTNSETQKPETNTSSIASVPSDDILNSVKLVPSKIGQCDAAIRTEATNDAEVRTCDKNEKLEKELTSYAQVPSDVQIKVHKTELCLEKQEPSEFLAPALPNDSLQDAPDSMQLRRSSFYSSISRNVRTNLEKYLDGRPQDLKAPKRSKKIKNGFLLHHGDNFPDDPEAPYRLHLATQVLLKLNKRRVKFKPKEDKGKSLLSYLKLQPKRVSRVGKHSKSMMEDSESSSSAEPTTSVFSGEWTVPRKYICNICGQVETAFWDMVMHKGEVHPGIVVTHVELSANPPEGFRRPPTPRTSSTLPNPPPCSKCGAPFNSYSDLHRHIFECAGNATVLEEATAPKVIPRKKKGKRKRGFKRRISSLPKKNVSSVTNKNPVIPTVVKSGEITKRRNSEVFKCEFCTREFKTEGWLKNHVSLAHSLPVSIPLEKLSLPTRASFSSSSRRLASQLLAKPSKQLSRET